MEANREVDTADRPPRRLLPPQLIDFPEGGKISRWRAKRDTELDTAKLEFTVGIRGVATKTVCASISTNNAMVFGRRIETRRRRNCEGCRRASPIQVNAMRTLSVDTNPPRCRSSKTLPPTELVYREGKCAHAQSCLHAVLPPATPHLLPAILLRLAAELLQSHASLHPLLAAHLHQSTQGARESKAFFVSGEDG